MGRNKEELSDHTVWLLDKAVTESALEALPERSVAAGRDFLRRVAYVLNNCAENSPDDLLSDGGFEFAAHILAIEMKEDLGEGEACRILTQVGKAGGKAIKKKYRLQSFAEITFDEPLAAVVRWIKANPGKASRLGLSGGNEDAIKQHVIRLREVVERQRNEDRPPDEPWW
jgi:hypothetical protein